MSYVTVRCVGCANSFVASRVPERRQHCPTCRARSQQTFYSPPPEPDPVFTMPDFSTPEPDTSVSMPDPSPPDTSFDGFGGGGGFEGGGASGDF